MNLGVSLQIVLTTRFLVPESFRGGCSVGVEGLAARDLSRIVDVDVIL